MDARKCAEALASVGASVGRGQVIHGEVDLLLDCYNANYDSMLGLFALVKTLPRTARIVLVLGSMKELGSETLALHRRLGSEASRLDVEAVFFFGTEAETAYQACADGKFAGHLAWTDDFDDLKVLVGEYVQPGDLVVLKGSRSNQLERLQSLWNVSQEDAHVL